MEKLERSGRLVDRAWASPTSSASSCGMPSTGGASDANTTAGMGVPTLDGLGPIGGMDHSPQEYLEVASIVPRTTLLAALIVAIGRDPEVGRWRAERAGAGEHRAVSRRHVGSGGPWEASGGYSRALAVGDACFVAGTTDAGPDGESRNPGDAAAQARAAFAIVEGALIEAGFALDDVVRTRMYVVDPGDADAVRRGPRRAVPAGPSRRDAGRGRGPDAPEPARRGGGGGQARRPRPSRRSPAARRATKATAATSPRNRFRRHATTATHSEHRHTSGPSTIDRAPASSVWTSVSDRRDGREDGGTDEPEVEEGPGGSRSMPGARSGTARDG